MDDMEPTQEAWLEVGRLQERCDVLAHRHRIMRGWLISVVVVAVPLITRYPLSLILAAVAVFIGCLVSDYSQRESSFPRRVGERRPLSEGGRIVVAGLVALVAAWVVMKLRSWGIIIEGQDWQVP